MSTQMPSPRHSLVLRLSSVLTLGLSVSLTIVSPTPSLAAPPAASGAKTKLDGTGSTPSNLALEPSQTPEELFNTRRLFRLEQMWNMYLVRNRNILQPAEVARLEGIRAKVTVPARAQLLLPLPGNTSAITQLSQVQGAELVRLLSTEVSGRRRRQIEGVYDLELAMAQMQLSYLTDRFLPKVKTPAYFAGTKRQFAEEWRTNFNSPALTQAAAAQREAIFAAMREQNAAAQADKAEREAQRLEGSGQAPQTTQTTRP